MKQRIDNKALTQYNILGVEVCGLTVIELHGLIEDYIRGQHKALILHVNVHCLNLCYRYHWLRGFLNQSQLAFCDGAGVQKRPHSSYKSAILIYRLSECIMAILTRQPIARRTKL